MKIIDLQVGPIMTNCYLLCEETAKLCAVIDPGDEPERIRRAVEDTGCTPAMILLTHGHFDHCTAVRGLLEYWPELPVYVHEKDVKDGAAGMDLKFARLGEKNQRYYREGDVLRLGALPIRVWETPGHSAGSVCLITADVIFSGDTLFAGSCGRTDFPDGSTREIWKSLQRLAALEGDYRVYPGHEESTTLERERRSNPYISHL